jgi:hypothetical protein
MGTPSAQTLVEFASEFFRELEEVPMTMVGGFDVHRKQITFDHVDTLHAGRRVDPARAKRCRSADRAANTEGADAIDNLVEAGNRGTAYVAVAGGAADGRVRRLVVGSGRSSMRSPVR